MRNNYRILCTLVLVLVVLNYVSCAPTIIGGSHYDAAYVEEVMRQAKAFEMSNFMNESVDPCDNFYTFACGNYKRINPANTLSQYATNLFERLSKASDRKVKQMLKNMDNDPIDTPEDKQIKRFFKSCIQMKKQSKDYRAKVQDLISEFGTMPVLAGDSWSEIDFDWIETTAKIAYRYGVSSIIGVDVFKNIADNEKNAVYIGQQEFPLETRSMYMDSNTELYRHGYTSKMAKRLHQSLGIEEELATKTATELMEFEVALANGLLEDNAEIILSEVAELTTVAAMQSAYMPTINVERLVNLTLGEAITDFVYEYNSHYNRNLIDVLKQTPLRTVANYIFFALIDKFALKSSSTDQETICMSITKEYFSKNLDNMIYRRYYNNATAGDIELMWKELKSNFNRTLKSKRLNWIAKETREYAIEKLEAMKLKINSYDSDNFTKEFQDLNMQDHDYFENIRQARMVSNQRTRKSLHQPAEPIESAETLSYTPVNILVENTIKVPVSLLQPYYLWAASYPQAIKFGSLASLIGHELVHGFDNNGRKFDMRGNSYDWWEEASSKRFEERQKCFTKQYSRYFYNNRYLTESSAQSENIADNGGVRLAYDGYLNWYDEAVRNLRDLRLETLPTMGYTSKQLFFISYAQIWCNDMHPLVRDLQTYTDQHVPGQFRVIGPLSNFKQFAEEFNCAKGTNMNPINKCEIY